MKIRYMSDLHLEGGTYLPTIMPKDRETTLILAGDIHTGSQAIPFLRVMCTQFKYVIYLFGNHEFYHHSIPEVRGNFNRNKPHLPDNLYILDNSTITLDGILFIGSTLWTDMRKQDPLVMHAADRHMRDFSVIFKGGDLTKLFSVQDSIDQHKLAVNFLREELSKQNNDNTVVVTHHLPTYSSVQPRWRTGHNSLLNGAFYSDLDYIIEDFKPAYWVHGHTHDTVFEPVWDTLVVCNPKGYGRENQKDFNPEAMFEI